MLLKHGLLKEGQVVILQPRRLATRLLAARVAEELGVQLGREVGYQIRFENVTGPETKIRFVTEGVLLRQMIDDRSEEHTSELQSRLHLVCRLLLEKKKKHYRIS